MEILRHALPELLGGFAAYWAHHAHAQLFRVVMMIPRWLWRYGGRAAS
ncbi:MAG: hypothetical protein M3P18_11045 [Actinomycetota bacterium]|nr:hypothetical protein [Actinomycetota bacterium]